MKPLDHRNLKFKKTDSYGINGTIVWAVYVENLGDLTYLGKVERDKDGTWIFCRWVANRPEGQARGKTRKEAVNKYMDDPYKYAWKVLARY